MLIAQQLLDNSLCQLACQRIRIRSAQALEGSSDKNLIQRDLLLFSHIHAVHTLGKCTRVSQEVERTSQHRGCSRQERILAKVSNASRTFARGSDDVASSLKRFMSQFGECFVAPTFLADSKSVHIFEASQSKAIIAWSKDCRRRLRCRTAAPVRARSIHVADPWGADGQSRPEGEESIGKGYDD